MNRAEKRATDRAMKRQISKLKQQGAEVRPLTVAIGYCWNEGRGVSGFWHQSILRVLSAAARRGIRVREIPVESGPFLSKARNTIVEAFLQQEDDYLLMTDTDMVFEGKDLELLLEADRSIAGALYYTAATGSAPWCTALDPEVDAEGNPTDRYRPVDIEPPPSYPDVRQFSDDEEGEAAYLAAVAAYQQALDGPDFQPRKVAAVGMGLTLIKREAVAAVRSLYENPFEFVGTAGEDLTFCLRAAEMDHETFLVPKARIGHVKQEVI